jgi:hypothetical protein
METQKDFENTVTEFIHRLPPMPGNVGELLNRLNLTPGGFNKTQQIYCACMAEN